MSQVPTDTERLDFIELYLERGGRITQEDGTVELVRAWQVVTAAPGTFRETLDLMMRQRHKFTNA